MAKTKKIFVIKYKYQGQPWEDIDSAETYLDKPNGSMLST